VTADLRLVGGCDSLSEALGIERDLVAIVGAGGKTTLLHRLGEEARTGGRRVVLTTTTKMGTDQERGLVVTGPDPNEVVSALDRHGICLVVSEVIGTKLVGVEPGLVDAWWEGGVADLVVVEADGARRSRIKLPASYEPVIPSRATVVVWVVSALAFGRPIAEVAHRPDRFADRLGVGVADLVTPELVAPLVTSGDGARRGVPGGARLVVAVTQVGSGELDLARGLADLVDPLPVIATAADAR